MLIDFFYTLRSAKLPVSVKEYLTLLEALQADVVGPNRRRLADDRTRTARRTRRITTSSTEPAAYFKGVEMLADFTKEVPLDWLRKTLEREFTAEEKAKIEKMGWDELMETLKKRFEEQKERHGRQQMDRHGRRTRKAFARRRRQEQECGKVWDQRATRTTTTARNSARGTSRSRCGGCEVRA
jgi:uncharacterized protein with von Willebrand factor type A (vWA) domain